MKGESFVTSLRTKTESVIIGTATLKMLAVVSIEAIAVFCVSLRFDGTVKLENVVLVASKLMESQDWRV